MKKTIVTTLTLLALPLAVASLSGCNSSQATTGISPQSMADALHAVMDSDRAVYTKKVVNRLVKDEKVIKASEHWKDDKALPLPAQMFRFGLAGVGLINKQNAPKTEAEKTGLKYIADNPGKNYYTEETLGGTKYFTAVYPDTAVAPVCVSCHNKHVDTPKTDFKIGDVMGGVVIRIPI